MRTFYMLIASMALSGITGCAQMQTKAALDTANATCESAYASASLDPIKAQVPKDARYASVSQLADPRTVRPDQKDAVEAIDPTYRACYEANQKYLTLTYGGQAAQMYGALLQNMKETEVALWSGAITFGQFNSLRARLVSNYLVAAQAVATRDALAAQQVQAQQQQAAAALMNALPRAQTTNCYAIGNAVNCTSR